MTDKPRCPWPGDIPIYVDYHDNEWGRPEHECSGAVATNSMEPVCGGTSKG